MQRYQPVIKNYGGLVRAEMRENERGQYYLRADVDERIAELERALEQAQAEGIGHGAEAGKARTISR